MLNTQDFQLEGEERYAFFLTPTHPTGRSDMPTPLPISYQEMRNTAIVVYCLC